MANATYTGENEPTDVGLGTYWYQPSTGQWRAESGGQWVLSQDGFSELLVGKLTVAESFSVNGSEGITGEFEGVLKKITIENGLVTEFELEE